MSTALPESVDVARQVQARRTYEGSLPLTSMPRLRESLASADGEVRYAIQFGKDALGISWLHLRVDSGLPLVCQRTLDVFVQRVSIDQRLGLIAREEQEASLPEGYEPLLVPDGRLVLADVVEDELILALPVVPLKPGAPLEWSDEPAGSEVEEERPNPFAVLGTLKKH